MQASLEAKTFPHRVGDSAFLEVPNRLRASIARLIGLFCLAATANTYLPSLGFAYPVLNHLRKLGLTVTLYLIGTGLSKSTLREVGLRPLLQGFLLWAIVAMGSLLLIRQGWIRL